jgi:DNA-binding SARP family transcriptional activator
MLVMVRVRLCGGVTIEADDRSVPQAMLAGRQGRLVLAYLVCERHRSVPREELADLIWGERPPQSWLPSLIAVVSKLRRALAEVGLDSDVLESTFGCYRLVLPDDASVDVEQMYASLDRAEESLRAGLAPDALLHAGGAAAIARRGFLTDDAPWVDAQRRRLLDIHVRALLVQAQAHRITGEWARALLAAREAVALDELREAGYRLLMQCLADAGERGEALRVWERCRILLTDELGVDPDPETEAVYLAVLADAGPNGPPANSPPLPSGVVTFLLTDIVESSALWERDPAAMTTALRRHDELVGTIAAAHGGLLLKTKLEGDATVSVFPRASSGVEAAVAIRDAFEAEHWPAGAVPRLRTAVHAGEAVERDGDYFGPALNRAARLRSLAGAGQILVSQAVSEVIRDHLPDGMALRSLGEQALRGLSRAEHVYEIVPSSPDDVEPVVPEQPRMPAPLGATGPFVGRGDELERLEAEWVSATAGTAGAVLIAGEPGVGKTRLAAEWARRAYDDGALVLYGRCDEELGAPYQPFAEALPVLASTMGAARIRAVRGFEELVRLAPDLADTVVGRTGPTQADPDTERVLLFDAVARLLAAVSAERPLLLVVDDLHWAAKPTLLLLRHLLRGREGTRLLVVGTYRSTDLSRTHPLAAILADLHRDGAVERITLGGLGGEDVRTYLSEAGVDDAPLGDALAEVTSGNPFFLIEVLRHLQETGGSWDATTLPQGVREAVGRRLARLSAAANQALLVAAVIGSRFDLELAERVLGCELLDPIDEARQAGLVVEEPGGRFRFNHALVRQSLLSEISTLRRIRLHRGVAAALEAQLDARPSRGDSVLAELARHWFECAPAGGAAKAVAYSRRAGEEAMERLAYEEAADLYDRALQAAEIDDSGCGETEQAQLLLARCEALLAAGDPATAAAVIERLQRAARRSGVLSAWASCYAAQLAVLTHPERLQESAAGAAAAAVRFAELGDADGEANAHAVQASCLARLGRVADSEDALDRALSAARRAGNARRVNAVLSYAPPAAVWGPSSIVRGSGRCMEVVRVVRITTRSPGVEAVALRCQALLEAQRGRTDAARRLLASARGTLESLGHTHGLLAADLFEGMIELTAGEAADAEALLRRAFDGFIARGVGVDAAQAAAHLARAVLMQGRPEEAIALTEASERLAGVDLQAAIAWRATRAEALAQQGDTKQAVATAKAGVVLADGTDALLDQADAHLALSVALRAAGRAAEADDERQRSASLYERKGASARVGMTSGKPHPSHPAPPMTVRRRVRPNLATAALLEGLMTPELIETWASRMTPGLVYIDHVVQTTMDRDSCLETFRRMSIGGRSMFAQTQLASLGSRVCLARWLWRSEAPSRSKPIGLAEMSGVNVWLTDGEGRIRRVERFADHDLNPALARLIEQHAEDERPDELSYVSRVGVQLRAGAPRWADDALLVDHRKGGLGTVQGLDSIRTASRSLGDTATVRRRAAEILGYTERIGLVDYRTERRGDDGGPFELAILWLTVHGDDGFLHVAEWFAPEQVDEALARFDALAAGSLPLVDPDAHEI